jgi:hypothetical protein
VPRSTSKKNTVLSGVGQAREDANASTDIESIEKLLNAAHDLMKREPSLAGAALEDIRRLKVRVRFAKSTLAKPKPEELPRVAPALFENRPNKNQSPLDFTVATYGPWLHKNICRADIRRLNYRLYESYFNWGITSEELDAIGLPTKRTIIEKKLQAAGPLKRPRQRIRMSEMPADERERARLWHVVNRRKRRAAKAQSSHE